MAELFKTTLVLSIFGFVMTALLLIIKPVTAKKLPASWQYYMWVMVMLSMLIPVYKIIPSREIYKIPVVPSVTTESPATPNVSETENTAPTEDAVNENTGAPVRKSRAGLYTVAAFIWLSGMAIYLFTVTLSYISFTTKKRKNSTPLRDDAILKECSKSLKIRRKIKVMVSENLDSPMLVGVLFPVIYIPDGEIPPEKLKMIFLHELNHYKRKDLIFKWLSVLTNMIHWFNPLSYLLCSALSEACEISCDMAVTGNMTEDEQRLYMQTILDLAKRR
ncbi:MAG: M56 family metallopeptidase [Clostridia bacterium]|nr:M56 family metallopeptidase [Clostridia bacterium]